MKTTNDFFIKTISPIHIGCDEIYELTGFTIDEQVKEMVVFDPFLFISQLESSEKDQFTNICSKGTISSILEIFQFLKNRSVKGRRVDICHGFIEHYNKTLGMALAKEYLIKKELNNFEIPRTAFRSVDQRPYIPGSSIKGALRTAYLNMMENDKKLGKNRKAQNAKELEQRLMNYDGIHSDPFRLVKVSDFTPVGDVKTRILYGINKKKTPSDREAKGFSALFETVVPGSVFQGTITVEPSLLGDGIREALSIKELLKSAMVFFNNESKREEKELSDISVKLIDKGENDREALSPVLLRVGRHSGAESLTVEGHRNIYIMGKKGKFKDHATTIWLASESKKSSTMNSLAPFGWVCLAGMTDDLSDTFISREHEWQEKRDNIAEEEKVEAERQKELERQTAEEEKKKAVEEEERKKEEERRRAEFEAMSPEERDIAAFSDPDLLEQQVVEIYDRLDGFIPENKIKVAKELKDYWVKNQKWKKKDCSKKQVVKVQNIKDILGE